MVETLDLFMRVAALALNVPAMHELHFAAPMAGALLYTLDTRWTPYVSVLAF